MQKQRPNNDSLGAKYAPAYKPGSEIRLNEFQRATRKALTTIMFTLQRDVSYLQQKVYQKRVACKGELMARRS